jgi:hypothetical protein
VLVGEIYNWDGFCEISLRSLKRAEEGLTLRGYHVGIKRALSVLYPC